MFSILNRALSWAITSFGNEFCVKKRLRLIEALDNGFYVKFMQLEIGLLTTQRSGFRQSSSAVDEQACLFGSCAFNKHSVLKIFMIDDLNFQTV